MVKPVDLKIEEFKEESCSLRGGIFNTRHTKTLTPTGDFLTGRNFLLMTTADALMLNLWKLLPHVIYRFKFLMLRQLEYISNEFY